MTQCLNCSKDYKKSSKNTKFCSITCFHERNEKEFLDGWLSGKISGNNETGICRTVRKWLLKKFDNKCSLCGWCEINPTTGKTPLEVDHIDGVWHNTTPENLRLLCPNCHSLTPTYRSLNIGKGRPYFKNNPRKPKITLTCKNCSKTLSNKNESGLCRVCYNKSEDYLANCFINKRKFHISEEELKKLVWEMPMVKIAEMFGVSDNAVKKRCKGLNILTPPRGYWRKVETGIIKLGQKT